ncbi:MULTISPECIES: glycerol-3-phosphate responsive antiterminator [Peptostreptococcus]|jgi:glycerol uptake operon antiterminator|uniref:glycerol-3-phosphate responsive antiterminator n=1 Tax=Peptostreptococcus TaxID=1257 RepID=UPI00033CB7F3|nr:MULTISPECIES: glycerol-3-phosphate responsive antiterminator [Peptostreptococcus]KXB71624.1 glycerol-3-phosphate responsive antiterminator [Peptostreptococcus anaerobius]MCB6983017.1 glycerol-3-phosphate responsive antiterminator [Peptostreptococcus anaerobius]MCQ5151147.1 glycerol-3-phosphate responsive antiterminator [Peptostreptococcus anaerobius]MDB8821468.1 glycerol-3-phosphate responsive antiterminator [Peptostreptococcus anaerobius]MDB8826162.1 glycerol-3-phosphate responsive antiter
MISARKLKEKFEDNPMVVAVTNEVTLGFALNSTNEIVFLLSGTISDLRVTVNKLLDKGKLVFVHIDMISGMSSSPAVVEFIGDIFDKKVGIITTKPALVKKAISENIRVIHRAFMVDSKSKNIFLDNITQNFTPDAVEIMPAMVHSVIREVRDKLPKMTIIAGGLVTDKKEIYEIINSGADAISTSSVKLLQD